MLINIAFNSTYAKITVFCNVHMLAIFQFLVFDKCFFIKNNASRKLIHSGMDVNVNFFFAQSALDIDALVNSAFTPWKYTSKNKIDTYTVKTEEYVLKELTKDKNLCV